MVTVSFLGQAQQKKTAQQEIGEGINWVQENAGINDQGLYECRECNLTYGSFEGLENHIRRH